MRKNLVIAILAAALFLIPAAAFADVTSARLAGADRYLTAIAISQAGWSTAENVILAPAADVNIIDALTVAPLAKSLNAPILVTAGTALTPSVEAELQRLGAKNIYIATGTGVITESVRSYLRNKGYNLTNLGGADRFATALNIAQEYAKLNPVNTIVVANAYDPPQLLTIAGIAAYNGWVILPFPGLKPLTPEISQFIQTQNPAKTYLIGVTVTISEVRPALPGAITIEATSSYDLTQNILDTFTNSFNYEKGVFIASGGRTHWVDSLTIAAYLDGAPLLLTDSDGLFQKEGAARRLDMLAKAGELGTQKVTAVGGIGSITEIILAQAKEVVVTQNAAAKPPTVTQPTTPTPTTPPAVDGGVTTIPSEYIVRPSDGKGMNTAMAYYPYGAVTKDNTVIKVGYTKSFSNIALNGATATLIGEPVGTSVKTVGGSIFTPGAERTYLQSSEYQIGFMGSRWQKGTPYEPITTTPQLPAWNSDWDSMFPALVAPEVTTVRNITYNAKGEIMDILYIYNPYETERLLRQYYIHSGQTLYTAGLGTRGDITLAQDVDLLTNLFYPWRTGMVPKDCVQVLDIQAWDEYFNGIFWATIYGSQPMGGGK